MKIFDFEINTQNAEINDFNDAVDFLRHTDLQKNRRVDNFEEKPLSYEEYKKWIKSIYILVERGVDYYLPIKNMGFLYRDFNFKDGLNYYLFIYILIEYMRKKECLLFSYGYFEEEITKTEKELTEFVNNSRFINLLISAYKPIIAFEIEKFNDFGRLFKNNNSCLDDFPFSKSSFTYSSGIDEFGKESFNKITFFSMRFIILEGKIYEFDSQGFYSDDKKILKYFNKHLEYKKQYQKLLKEIITIEIKKEELYKQNLKIWNERQACAIQIIEGNKKIIQNDLKFNNYFMHRKFGEKLNIKIINDYEILKLIFKINQCSCEIDRINKQILELSSTNKIRTFLLSLPNFVIYREL